MNNADDVIAQKLDELIAATKAASMPVKERWLDAAGVAALLSVSAAHVLERIAPRPGFPAALRIGGTGHPRWKAAEVLAWAEQERERGTGRRIRKVA
jgi:predicted DNA-binding transcriptional regulator AlpA